MESGLFGVPVDLAGRNSISMDEVGSLSNPNALVHFDSFDLNNQNPALAGYAMPSTLHGEYINNSHRGAHLANRTAVLDSHGVVTTLGRNMVTDASPGSSRPMITTEFQEQFVGGTPISTASLATLLAARSGLRENMNNLEVSGPSTYPLEVLRTYPPNERSNALNSSFASSVNYECEVFDCSNKGEYERYSALQELGGSASIRTGFQPYATIGNSESQLGMNASIENSFGSCKFSNVLSLSLATSHPSVINGTSIPDQCSEISCSGASRQSLKQPRLGSEKASLNSRELSLSCGSRRAGQFSQVVSGSKYLQAIQEILAQIASYSLDNLENMSLSAGVKNGVNTTFSSSYCIDRGRLPIGSDESSSLDTRREVDMDPALQKRALEAKKAQLLALLQVVDERYNQCLDEIHKVISAFHAATELDPQIHTRFALQTISLLYKSLRERISNQILAIGAHLETGFMREAEGSFDTSFFQKQWALQQLKKKDHQLWRPQRGLPERSVSVLRAWMFQNFLHPYPKDAEKHLLAVKSGLTRSQVSNWFINARVRLWKPMIEEMYAEMSRRKALQNEEGTNRNHRGHISISNPRFDVNY
ncbi:hypothetical protein Tsubulata_013215 [Turnera subulata]|uniref:Homeobox domain-containing protein n=1 Tax=Turnera subulata TaxID=218843 RepID=A0A9Q0FMF7_9ROSI|nr:hypothetical protein Tsubulata_013215 [Turnera subulata]